ncbi:MAG: double-strand break repair protein AddB [Actinobacteria bacterium]|nr:MAG: double-strand break repair protein AddB [Actinomycetota bacterium]
MRPVRRIYTVPPGRPFLTALAEALLAGNLPIPGGVRPAPMQLADVTLLLPTRRATRALQEAFLAAGGGGAMLLPKIRPIIGSGEEPTLFTSALEFAGGVGEAAPAIGEIERQLLLAVLVQRWADAERDGRGPEADIGEYRPTAARTPAQAARLARELAGLMDAMEIEDVDYAKMQALVPDTLAAHWETTLDFLRIVTERWPAVTGGRQSKMQRDKQQVLAQASQWRKTPPDAPVIVAGVMSSVPAVTELLRVVTGLPNGALVLPGLDQGLDEESWQTIVPAHPEHPQFGLKKLLDALEARREDVLPLPGLAPTTVEHQRAGLVSEALRPARTTERWHRFTAKASKQEMAQAVAGVAILEAPSAEDEAEAIALILREVAERSGRTAALVTPDRPLARRVAVRLEAWGLRVDDSAGQAFAKTAVGALLDLTVEAAAKRFEPVALVCLLKHPLCRLGMPTVELRRAVRALELAAFRTPYFGQGLDGVASALERAQADMREGKRRHRVVRNLKGDDWQAARKLVKELGRIVRPLGALFQSSAKAALRTIAKAHVEAAQALARAGSDGQAGSLWQGEAGEQAAKFFATLLDGNVPAPDMAAADYPEFYRSLVANESILPRGAAHPRIAIWGPYESRLQQPDVAILGSLNEGTWPQAADPGPWLNRPMRAALGLPAPEERIGDAAHIFTSLLGVTQVYLTRAAKIDGVPTVPSRWLLRLQALLAGLGHTAKCDQPWLAWAQGRNALAGPVRPVRAPEPRPALDLRPRRLSVTTIEKWIANPYAIFAQRILGLEPLPMLGRQPDAALRGQIVHDALGRFAARFPQRLPDDVCAELVGFAEAGLAELTGSPRVAAFWAPRFARFAAWFAETEHNRREGVDRILAEVEGSLVLAGTAGPFMLTARADRIDVGKAGLIITDYKTGGNIKDLASRATQGEAPQLPLEAAIAAAGGFTGLPAAKVAELRYISGSGGEPPGQECTLKNGDVAQLARAAQQGLEKLIAAYDNAATPYRALRRARFTYRYDDYAHLARVAEWSAETDEEV